MNSIEQLVREHISAGSSAGLILEIRTFCMEIEEPTLNLKVREALTFGKQGHFNKAMLSIAEANRDQVIAIRKIQNLIGQVRSEPYPEVVFEKFRQIEPFEIGIAEAGAVLSILARLGDKENPELQEQRLELHENELRKKDEEEYLAFLERRFGDGSESEKMDETRSSIDALAQKMTEIRSLILEKVFVVADDTVKGMRPGIDKDRAFLELSRNIFLVVMSPILTKPAGDVVAEI